VARDASALLAERLLRDLNDDFLPLLQQIGDEHGAPWLRAVMTMRAMAVMMMRGAPAIAAPAAVPAAAAARVLHARAKVVLNARLGGARFLRLGARCGKWLLEFRGLGVGFCPHRRGALVFGIGLGFFGRGKHALLFGRFFFLFEFVLFLDFRVNGRFAMFGEARLTVTEIVSLFVGREGACLRRARRLFNLSLGNVLRHGGCFLLAQFGMRDVRVFGMF
jgi:hypothetical protein